VIIGAELATNLVRGVNDSAIVEITALEQTVINGTSEVVRFDINIVVDEETVFNTTSNFTVQVDLSGVNMGDINPNGLVAMQDGQLIMGEFNQATGIFTFETNMTGNVTIHYLQNLIRLSLQVGDNRVIDHGRNIIHQMDIAPLIYNDRVLVPVRFVAEALGATVNWVEATQTISITLDGETIIFTIGQLDMDVPAIIIDGRTMVPLRFIAESFGGIVNWDPATAQIEIIII